MESKRILEQGLVSPCDSGILVGGSVSIAWDRSRLTSEDSVEVGALLVGSTLLFRVRSVEV